MSAVGGCSGAGGCAVAFASTESLAADSRFSGMILIYIPVSYLLALLVLQSIVSLLLIAYCSCCMLCPVSCVSLVSDAVATQRMTVLWQT